MLDLAKAQCLVVGGGKVAARKVELLLECGARVRVVSPVVCPQLEELLNSDSVDWAPREFEPGDVDEVRLVVAATDDAGVNEAVAVASFARGVLVNVVDCAPLSNFIVPSVLRQGDLTIAVSTAGASPALAQHIRKELERSYGVEYAAFLRLLAGLRSLVIDAFPAGGPREEVFHRLASQGLLAGLTARDAARVAGEIEAVLGAAYVANREAIGHEIAAALGLLDGEKAGEV